MQHEHDIFHQFKTEKKKFKKMLKKTTAGMQTGFVSKK